MGESSAEARAALQVGGKDLKQMQQLGVWEEWEVQVGSWGEGSYASGCQPREELLRPSLGVGSTAAPLTEVVWWQGWREEQRRKVMALHPPSVLCLRGSGQAGAEMPVKVCWSCSALC